MSDTLTQLASKIQAALGDTGTYFTTAICTAAVRAALSEINERAPVLAGELVDVVADQKEYEVTDSDSLATGLIDVLEQDTSGGEDDTPLKFDTYWEDARLFFRLRDSLSSGTLVVRYSKPHTVSGLDSATESTLPGMHDPYIVIGAAYHAILIRSVARTETINLQQAVPTNYDKLADNYRKLFDGFLAKLSAQQAAVGEPRTDAWNDEWHNWDK